MRSAWAVALALACAAPALADEAGQVLAAVNQQRAKAGCAALVANPRLEAAAQVQARAMAEKNFFGHGGKGGFAGRIKAQGYRYSLAAENIAAGQKTAAGAVQAWMDSSGHRKNMLNCKLRETGIAMVYQADDAPLQGSKHPMNYYWVQVFGSP